MSCDADISYFFFFNDTATTEIYTLSLHDALPISFQAAIAARNQGEAAFERFHMALLRARHEQNLDHWKRNTLLAAARDADLDLERFEREMTDRALLAPIGEDYTEARDVHRSEERRVGKECRSRW